MTSDSADAHPLPEGQTLWHTDPREACRRWLTTHSQQHYAAHSVAQYTAMVGHADRWLRQCCGKTLLQAHAGDLDALLLNLRGRQGQPASGATQQRYVSVLSLVMAHLQTLALREDNPVTALRHPAAQGRSPRQAPRFLTPAQAQTYLDWTLAQPRQGWGDVRDAALRLIYLACGITVNESRQLLITDVLPDDTPLPLVRIRSLSPVLARSIAVPETCVPVLQQWRTQNSQLGLTRALAFPARKRSPHLARTGSQAREVPISTSEIYEIVRPAMQAAGFDDQQQGAQTLRNSYAVGQLVQGVSLQTLQQQMGLHTPWSIDALRREMNAQGLAHDAGPAD